MMKSKMALKRLRTSAWPAILLALAFASFYLTRAFLATAEEAHAAPPPPQTTKAERTRLLQEDAARPKFQGQLNGFTFFLPGSGFDVQALARQRSPKCTGTNARYVAEETAATSQANFTLAYLPAGVQQTSMSVTACEDDVFNISKTYAAKGVLISVLRVLGPAVSSSSAPVERIEAMTIGGRASIVIRGVFPEQGTEIQMRDGTSLWVVTGRGITVNELIKVADGVK